MAIVALPSTRFGRRVRSSELAQWLPLTAALVVAAALRFTTIGEQSLWYDEAFTPVHVLHASLGATLAAVAHHENTPPLWYVLIWAWSRVFGLGAVALRFPSGLAGVATVPVAWAIARELAGRRRGSTRGADVCAWIVAVNPLFVWYSQEARAYALFVLLASVAMLCFLRAEREPTPGRLAQFAIAGSLALLSHYFAAFLLAPMALLLLRRKRRLRVTAPAVAVLGLVALALVPLIVSQHGQGAQWIAAWALTSRLAAIPQYYLTGYSGAPLGHSIELLVALPLLAGIAVGVWRGLAARERAGAGLALGLAACGVAIPLALALVGLDYLAPRNVVAAMIPLSVAIAVVVASQHSGRTGLLLAVVSVAAFAAVTIDVDFNPRLQRADWRTLAKRIERPLSSGRRVITTVELGSAPLEYYLAPLHNLREGSSVRVSEIDETGYVPLRAGAGAPPAPGFRLRARIDVNGLIAYRWVASRERSVSEATLRRSVITAADPEVLVPGSGVSSAGAP